MRQTTFGSQARRAHPKHSTPSSSLRTTSRGAPRSRRTFAVRAQEVSAVVLPQQTPAQLDRSCQLLERHVQVWLDEEWTPMEQHSLLAREAVQAYRTMREEGEDDLSALLLGVGSDLMGFDFKETFTDAFEVSNKLAALVMQQAELEVCCQSETEQEQFARVEQAGARE